MLDESSRVRGAIYGLLIGDALGVPYEFHAPDAIPPFDQIEFEPPEDFRRTHSTVKPGTWSDDGAQALCLTASLLECGKLDPDDLGQRFLKWYDTGYMAVDNIVFDAGITTIEAIDRLRAGTNSLAAGPSDERSNGNGALMRVLPLAIWHRGSDSDLIADAFVQSSVTHGHLRSKICCALLCLYARNVFRAQPEPWKRAYDVMYEAFASEDDVVDELKSQIHPEDEPEGKGSGYVVDSLRSALMVLNNDSYEKIVRAAVQLGDDTDTTACIAGGIAGLRYGEEAIPERWRNGLRGRDIVEPLLQRLVEHVCAS